MNRELENQMRLPETSREERSKEELEKLVLQEFAVEKEKNPQTLSEYLREKLGDVAPKVSLRFFSAPHLTETDVEGIEERMNETDIFIPEAAGWNEDTLKNVENISLGEISPSQVFFSDPYIDKMFGSLYESHKPVTIIDVPQEEAKKMEMEIKSNEPNKNLSFKDSLEQMSNAGKSMANIMVKGREQYMISQLGPKILEILETHPKLKTKKEITVLLPLGYAHTGIIKELRKDKETAVTKDLRYPISVFDYSHEIIRRHFFGKEVSETIKEKALFEQLLLLTSFFSDLHQKMKNSNTFAKLERFLADSFSSGEIREIFEEWKCDGNFEALFLKRLQEKGLKIPKNDEDAEKMMGRTASR